MTQHKICCGVHYPIPIHCHKNMKCLGYKNGAFPNAEYLAQNELSLPLHPNLTDYDIEFISETLKQLI